MDQKAALAALAALAQETRLEVFRLLVTVGPEGLPAGVIAERLGVLPSSLTFHLNLLHRAGLIRYIVLYLAVLTIIWAGIFVTRLGGIFNFAWIVVIIVLLVAARVVFWNFGGKPYEEDS